MGKMRACGAAGFCGLLVWFNFNYHTNIINIITLQLLLRCYEFGSPYHEVYTLDFIYVSVDRVFTKWFYIDGNWHEEAVEEFEEENDKK